MVLRASKVTVRFGGIRAVDAVSLTLGPGEIVGLIGPNGAGKTTLVNVLSGFQRPSAGTVSVDGVDASRWPAERFARSGIVRTFQAVRLFAGLTLAENVETGLAGRGLGRSRARRRAKDLLAYVGLEEKCEARGDALSYGDERRAGIARALALEPSFLLLDEPAAGMNLAEADALGQLIRAIRDDFGCGVLVIEHNMTLIMDLCERLQVVATGSTIGEGRPREIMANAVVRAAYLGEEEAA